MANITPEQKEMIRIALEKKFSGQSEQPEEEIKYEKRSELDKKIIAVLKLNGKPTDLESEDAQRLRMYLSGMTEYKPEWLKVEDKGKKSTKENKKDQKYQNEPSLLFTEYEKLENKFQDRVDELWDWMEDQDYDEDKIYKELANDARLEVLFKKMKLNIDKQIEFNVIEDYIQERQRDDWPFVEEIQEYLNEKGFGQKDTGMVDPNQLQQQQMQQQPPPENLAHNVPVPGQNKQGLV